jgi:hypothetical protein
MLLDDATEGTSAARRAGEKLESTPKGFKKSF